VERNRKAGQKPPRVLAPTEEEEEEQQQQQQQQLLLLLLLIATFCRLAYRIGTFRFASHELF
jgi:hypothetical protein